ncbi:hypothetical protein AYO44_10565 [Planctomycetaceae bacterium SCGC AG-212-F19]|nr:hypothetical protein AYO44_10565 [Planctomycetaceae bacterium SCGC AG-212-F19]
MNFLKSYYGTTEGPLGFPMHNEAAQTLDAILRALPKSSEFAYRKAVGARGLAELLPGERGDVSWITSEEPDRANEVVLARGMDDSHFKLNPIVTLQHAYHLPPVGRSLWRKVVKDGPRMGVKAKTHYPPRPDSWPGETWPADAAFALIQADLLRGKSIGFLPTKVHAPTTQEREQAGWGGVELVIDGWLLLEYACCFLPCQQHAVVEAFSKALPVTDEVWQALGVDRSRLLALPAALPPIAFTPLEEIEKGLHRALSRLDLAGLAEQLVHTELDRLRGRV